MRVCHVIRGRRPHLRSIAKRCVSKDEVIEVEIALLAGAAGRRG
jgi:hypothetical protein